MANLSLVRTMLIDTLNKFRHWGAHVLRAQPESQDVRRLPAPFIVGSPRSGTTLLRFMLDAHPELAIPPETGFIVPVSRLPWRSNTLRHAFFQIVTRYPIEAPGWADFGLNTTDFWEALLQIEPFTVSAGLRCFYQTYAARFSKPRWGDKTPEYGRHLKYIEQILPEAHFIHLIRDGPVAPASVVCTRHRYQIPGPALAAQCAGRASAGRTLPALSGGAL